MSKQNRKPKRREKPEYDQKLLNLARVTRVVKGGRRFRFRATLVIGNRKGKVGVGVAKGSDVSDAIQKSFNDAKRNMVSVLLDGSTIPHDVREKLGSAVVLLKPGIPGQGIIAGGAVRAVMDLAGIKDIVSKSLGASNPLNVARATVLALSRFRVKLNGRQSETTGEAIEQESVTVADSASDSEVPARV